MRAETPSPISFAVSVARLPQKGMPVVVEPTREERAALAAEHGLRSVEWFRAELEVTSWRKGGVRVVGRVRAEIVQDCIVTLEPVNEAIDEPVSALFLPEGSRLAVPKRSAEGEILLDAEGEDGPETFSGDTIDVGQLAEEYFALGINPYPRKAGATVEAVDADAEDSRGPLHEKLAALKRKL
jgi:hypothetical protein